MGSIVGKNQPAAAETPEKCYIFKRIDDPRSPTDEINRTPVEVVDKVSKGGMRRLACSNALKQQNYDYPDASPKFVKKEASEKVMKIPKYPFSKALDSAPILDADDSCLSLDVSTNEKENVH